MPGVCQLVKFN